MPRAEAPLSLLGRGAGGEGLGLTCKTEPSELHEHSRPLPARPALTLSPGGRGNCPSLDRASELHEHSRPLPNPLPRREREHNTNQHTVSPPSATITCPVT